MTIKRVDVFSPDKPSDNDPFQWCNLALFNGKRNRRWFMFTIVTLPGLDEEISNLESYLQPLRQRSADDLRHEQRQRQQQNIKVQLLAGREFIIDSEFSKNIHTIFTRHRNLTYELLNRYFEFFLKQKGYVKASRPIKFHWHRR